MSKHNFSNGLNKSKLLISSSVIQARQLSNLFEDSERFGKGNAVERDLFRRWVQINTENLERNASALLSGTIEAGLPSALQALALRLASILEAAISQARAFLQGKKRTAKMQLQSLALEAEALEYEAVSLLAST